MEFEWDEEKSKLTRKQRGFGFEEIITIFKGRTIIEIDDRFDYGEVRQSALGLFENGLFKKRLSRLSLQIEKIGV